MLHLFYYIYLCVPIVYLTCYHLKLYNHTLHTIRFIYFSLNIFNYTETDWVRLKMRHSHRQKGEVQKQENTSMKYTSILHFIYFRSRSVFKHQQLFIKVHFKSI